MFEKTTLIVSTCEKNKFLLDNFFRLLKTNFDYKGPIKITINSNYNYPEFRISVIDRKMSDTSFSTSLIYALKEIKTDYIIFMLEDFYLLKKVDIKVIQSALSILDNDKSIDFIQLNDRTSTRQSLYSKKAYNKYFLVKNKICPYSCNAQFGIWRKKFLLKVLRLKESAWQFEYYGSLRVNKFKHTSLTINDKYKEGSKLYPDGGILARGQIIKKYSKLYEKFNLTPFCFDKSVLPPLKCHKSSRIKKMLMERFYPFLSTYFPFLSKFVIIENYVSEKIWKSFDCDFVSLKDKENY